MNYCYINYIYFILCISSLFLFVIGDDHVIRYTGGADDDTGDSLLLY